MSVPKRSGGISERYPVESPVGFYGPYGRMAGVVKGWVGTNALDVECIESWGIERHTVALSSVVGHGRRG